MTSSPSGVLLIDKPAEWTSHDVVARLRSVLRQRRVGHAGTLDPFATGLLVIGVGAGTRLLPFLSAQPKTYEATIRLGRATNTDDLTGEPGWGGPTDAVTFDEVSAVLAGLTGPIMQRPSAFSAVKVDGVRSYKRARAGEDVALPPRPVTVYEMRPASGLRAAPDAPGELEVDVVVTCSAGTYVRALARDAGEALGVGGHLTALRRIAVGGMAVTRARPVPSRGTPAADVWQDAWPLHRAAAAAMPTESLTEEQTSAVRHGQRIPGPIEDSGPVALVDPAGLVAVADAVAGQWRYRAVFPPAE